MALNVLIDKLMIWKCGSWNKFGKKNSHIMLRLCNDQLLFLEDAKVLECINVTSKIKGVYKEDVLLLMICNKCQEVRKLKFQIKSNLPQCLHVLGQYFPISKYGSTYSKNIFTPRYRTIEETLRNALQNNDEHFLTMPPEYESFVKLCLLDPSFPQVVNETQKILCNDILKH